MARPLRIEFPGAIYHVTSRGDHGEPVFDDDNDRLALLSVIAQALERFAASALAYCLMDNHYHLVIQTRRANLSRLMRQVNGVYTQEYNRRHDKAGPLFQGRFKGILVDKDAYLLEVCRYVDLNPVRTRDVREPGNWRWSSYRAHTGKVAPPGWLDTAAVQRYVLGRDAVTAADRRKAQSRYAALVAAGKGIKLWDEALSRQIFLGGEAFIKRMQALGARQSEGRKNRPRLPRRAAAKPIAYYLKRRKDRNAGIYDAFHQGQHSMTDIGKATGLSVSSVSRIVRRAETRAVVEA
jgi:putative transposase